MIRINLLGQERPRAARRAAAAAPGGTLPLVFILAGVGVGALALFLYYITLQKDFNQEQARIKQLQAQKTELEQIKQQVEAFEKQKADLQKRVNVIEQLQRDRTGGQALLDMMVNTVSRTENLWLTSLIRKGNGLSIDGAAASINSVANFITQLKRSGYFQKIEIKESKQDDKNLAVQTFTFQMTAEVSPPPAAQARTGRVPLPFAPLTRRSTDSPVPAGWSADPPSRQRR